MANLKFGFARNDSRTVDERREAVDYGKTGEQMATRYLEEAGYVILDRNYRRRQQEVDIIALDHDELAVIEVKSRTENTLLAPEEAVDHRKRQHIIRVANNYVLRHHRTEPVRYDIIAITGHGAEAQIRHIKNAFNVMCH